MADQKEDLDAFLTGVESKLRGPFSSLDLAKAISTTALRGSLSPKEYLELIGKVVERTDKVIQLRILVGLLGLEVDASDEIFQVLQQTQEASSHEEWVRTISGLIQGIMFDDPKDPSREKCRGQEAKTLLRQTCNDICKRVHETQNENDKDTTADMNIFFTPYRYSLLGQNILEKLIPESQGNPHFSVNEGAEVLQVDNNMELQRAKEEQEHKAHLSTKSGNGSAPAVVPTTKAPGLPGYRPTKLTGAGSKASSKGSGSSMFLASKKPTVANRATLQSRKPGAARAQLMKNSLKQRLANKAATGSAGAAGGGRSAALQKSKMKLIDISEVKEQATKDNAKGESTAQSKKRKIMDAAAKNGLMNTKKSKVDTTKVDKEDSSVAKPVAPVVAAAASQEQSAPVEPTSTSVQAPVPPSAEPSQSTQPDWKIMLKDRSNKLSSDDRFRIQQFFEQRFNPTPDQPIYKMKLHEARTTDPNSGQAIKETYYLELNYNTFDSKQSKKIKRY
jgi:hypothetical protein